MVTLTPAQDSLRHNNTHHRKINRPTIMTNKVERAFNCVLHQKLKDILQHFGFPSSLVETIADFNTNRRMYLEFDGQRESAVDFPAGLPQGSPLSPILYVVYVTAIAKYTTKPTKITTTYVDNEMMLQGAKPQRFATQRLQDRLTYRIERGLVLNIQYLPTKTQLMHLAGSNNTKAIRDETTIQRYDQEVPPTNYLGSLGVWVDHRLIFKRNVAFT